MNSRIKQSIVLAIAVALMLLATPLAALAGPVSPAVQEQQAVEWAAVPAAGELNTRDTADDSTLAARCAYSWKRQLYFTRPNMRGEDVKELQVRLNRAVGTNLDIDGLFGPKTRQAVMKFQRVNDLAVDGIVGPRTQAALDKVCPISPIRKRVP